MITSRTKAILGRSKQRLLEKEKAKTETETEKEKGKEKKESVRSSRAETAHRVREAG